MQKVCVEKKKIETMEEWQLNEKNDTKIAEWQNQEKNPYCQKLNLKSFLTCSSLCKHCRDKNMLSKYFPISKLHIKMYLGTHEYLRC